jgi:methionyl-tRNA formyltransferase
MIFLGTSPFAVPSLTALAADPRFEIRAVVTQPDRPVGRKQVITPPPVKVAALSLHLPVLQPENIDAIHDTLSQGGKPDFLVVVSYGQLLTERMLKIPSVAPVNVHASLLPTLRGASPIQNAILAGLPMTGVTVQRMVRELDAGPMLGSQSLPIAERETFSTLHEKLASIGASLLIRTLSAPLREQGQNEKEVTFCKKLTKADGIADRKTMDAATIDRMVRALTPWPGVTLEGNKLIAVSLTPSEDALPLPCRDGTTLFIVTIQPPSGKPMTGKAFAAGHTL